MNSRHGRGRYTRKVRTTGGEERGGEGKLETDHKKKKERKKGTQESKSKGKGNVNDG